MREASSVETHHCEGCVAQGERSLYSVGGTSKPTHNKQILDLKNAPECGKS